jgi:ABC-2 type transport system permease protein
MPAGVRFFAEHQPLTPMIDTVRGLLCGTHIGNSAIVVLAWCTRKASLAWSGRSRHGGRTVRAPELISLLLDRRS